MKNILIFLLLSLAGLSTTAQATVKKHVRRNTVPIRSINIIDTAYEDLMPIAEAIGDSRFVLLGEQDHGDAPTFLAKARLIRFLHEKLGFDVLAFESDFYGLTTGWGSYQQGQQTIEELIQREVFPIWTECDACGDLFKYVKKTQETKSPIILSGFDSQLHGSRRRKYFAAHYSALLQRAAVPERWINNLAELADSIAVNYPLNNSKISFRFLHGNEQLLDSVVAFLQPFPDSSFVKILTQSLQAYVKQSKYLYTDGKVMMKARDEQMAANLLWLARYKYPNQKIIVWAANGHIMKESETALVQGTYTYRSMGSALWEKLGDQMYILGFTSYSGTAGRIYVPPFTVPPPSSYSIEQWLSKHKTAYAFINLKPLRYNTEVYSSKPQLHRKQRGMWHRMFDGLFYIQTMYPCRQLKNN